MVVGLDVFRDRFGDHAGRFVLIGGAACHEWFARDGLPFRATKDLDIVLIIEALDASFVSTLRQFVREGRYAMKERSSGTPELYRFSKPEVPGFPYMLELFSRRPDTINIGDDQTIVPIVGSNAAASLSAILLDDAYYVLIQEHVTVVGGLPLATASALIPLKARAWLDLSSRQAAGESIDTKEIRKHRADVFRLAALLPGEPGPVLANSVRDDLKRFLDEFPEDSTDWPHILAARSRS